MADSATTTSDSVRTAFHLGWRLAEVYHDPPPTSRSKPVPSQALPAHLPGASERSDFDRAKALIAQIHSDTVTLSSSFGTALDEVKTSLSALIPAGVAPEVTKTTLLTAHATLWSVLGANNGRLATALDLGRMLADTVLLSDATGTGLSADAMLSEFNPYRLANAQGWLNDLHALFPDNAANAVAGSLELWMGWVADRHGKVDPGDHEQVVRALHEQGKIWRRLLTGEQSATDLLTAKDYEDAGMRTLKRLLSLLGGYIRSWWYVIVAFVAIVAAIVIAIVRLGPNGELAMAGLIATAAGSLGISWKALGSTLGTVVGEAQSPLWKKEVRVATVSAVTNLPELSRLPKVLRVGRKAKRAPEYRWSEVL